MANDFDAFGQPLSFGNSVAAPLEEEDSFSAPAPAQEPEQVPIFGDYNPEDTRVQVVRQLGQQDGDTYSWAKLQYNTDTNGRLSEAGRRAAAKELANQTINMGFLDKDDDVGFAQVQHFFAQMMVEQEEIRFGNPGSSVAPQVDTQAPGNFPGLPNPQDQQEDADPFGRTEGEIRQARTQRDNAEDRGDIGPVENRDRPENIAAGTQPGSLPSVDQSTPEDIGGVMGRLVPDAEAFTQTYGGTGGTSLLLKHLKSFGASNLDIIKVEQAIAREGFASEDVFSQFVRSLPADDTGAAEGESVNEASAPSDAAEAAPDQPELPPGNPLAMVRNSSEPIAATSNPLRFVKDEDGESIPQTPEELRLVADDVESDIEPFGVGNTFRGAFNLATSESISSSQSFVTDLNTALENGVVGRTTDAVHQLFGIERPNAQQRAAEFAQGREAEATQRRAALERTIKELDDAGYAPRESTDVRSARDAAEYMAQLLGGSIPDMATAISTGSMGPVVSAITLGGQTNEELRERTDLAPDKRAQVAAATGSVMAAFETLGLGTVFSRFLPGDVAVDALSGTLTDKLVSRGVPRAAAESIQGALGEGVTEGLQETIAVAAVALSGGDVTAEELRTRLREAAIGGSAAGGAFNTVGQIASAAGTQASPSTPPSNPLAAPQDTPTPPPEPEVQQQEALEALVEAQSVKEEAVERGVDPEEAVAGITALENQARDALREAQTAAQDAAEAANRAAGIDVERSNRPTGGASPQQQTDMQNRLLGAIQTRKATTVALARAQREGREPDVVAQLQLRVDEAQTEVANRQAALEQSRNGRTNGWVPVNRTARKPKARNSAQAVAVGDLYAVLSDIPTHVVHEMYVDGELELGSPEHTRAKRDASNVLESLGDNSFLRENALDFKAPDAGTLQLQLFNAQRRTESHQNAVNRLRADPALAEKALAARASNGKNNHLDMGAVTRDFMAGTLSTNNLSKYVDTEGLTARQRQTAEAQLRRAATLNVDVTRTQQQLGHAMAKLRNADAQVKRASRIETQMAQASDTIEFNAAVAARTEAQSETGKQQLDNAGVANSTPPVQGDAEAIVEAAVLHVAEMAAGPDGIDEASIRNELDTGFGISDPEQQTDILTAGLERQAEVGTPEFDAEVDAASENIAPFQTMSEELGDTLDGVEVDSAVLEAEGLPVEEQQAINDAPMDTRPGSVRYDPATGMHAAAEGLRRISQATNTQAETILAPLVNISSMSAAETAAHLGIPEPAAVAFKQKYDTHFAAYYDRGASLGGLALSVPGTRGMRVTMVNPELSPEHQVKVAFHEMAHAMEADLLSSATDKTRQKLMEEFIADQPYEERRTASFPDFQGPAPDGDHAEYRAKFREWFASRVGFAMFEATSAATSKPKGLVERLVDRAVQWWRKALPVVAPRVHVDSYAAAQMITEVMANPGPMRNLHSSGRGPISTGVFIDDAGNARLYDPDEGPAAMVIRPRGMNDSDKLELRRQANEMMAHMGVTLKIATKDARGGILQRYRLQNRPAAYVPSNLAGYGAHVVVDTDQFNSVAAAMSAVQQTIVAERGMNSLLGAQEMNTLVGGLGSKRAYNNRLAPRLRGIKKLGKLRDQVEAQLRASGDPKLVTSRAIGQQMLTEIAADIQGDGKTHTEKEALKSLTNYFLRARDARGNSRDIVAQKKTLVDLLVAARDVNIPVEVAQGAAKQRARLARRYQLTNFFSRKLGLVDKNNVPNAPDQNGQFRGIKQVAGAASTIGVFSRSIPFNRIKRWAETAVAPSDAVARGRQRLAQAATRMVDSIEGVSRHRDRLRRDQSAVIHNYETSVDAAVTALGGDPVEAEVAINAYMVARHSIERNRIYALVYGELNDMELEAQRQAIIKDHDARVEQLWASHPKGRDFEAQEQRDLIDSQIDDAGRLLSQKLEDLILQDKNNPVSIHLRNSDQSADLVGAVDWQNRSGVSNAYARSRMEAIEKHYGEKVATTLAETGLDSARDRIARRSMRNRWHSGIAGRKGMRAASRLGYSHYVPLRGATRIDQVNEQAMLTGQPMQLQPQMAVQAAKEYNGAERGSEQARGALQGRRQLADSSNLRDDLYRDWIVSTEEAATNAMHLALVNFAESAQEAGLVGADLDQIMNQEGISEENRIRQANRNLMARATKPKALITFDEHDRPHTDTELVEVSGAQVLAFDPDGDVIRVDVNADWLWDAVSERYESGTAVAQIAKGYTGFASRRYTTMDPTFTYFRGPYRDLVETGVALATSEFGVPAKDMLGFAPNALAYSARLHQFFLASTAKKRDLLKAAYGDTDHPLHLFAVRERNGHVQLFRDELGENQSVDGSRNVLTGRQEATVRGLQPVQRATDAAAAVATPVKTLMEGMADAMEQGPRQAMFDVLYKKHLRAGMTSADAANRAGVESKQIMNYDNMSKVGKSMQTLVPFAQVSLTDLYHKFSRRMWRDGEPPLRQYTDERGQVREELELRRVWGQLNKGATAGIVVASAATAAMQYAVLTNGTYLASYLWTLFSDDEDEMEEYDMPSLADERAVLDLMTSARSHSGQDKSLIQEAVAELSGEDRQNVKRAIAAYGLGKLDPLAMRDPYELIRRTPLGFDEDGRDLSAPGIYGLTGDMGIIGKVAGLAAYDQLANDGANMAAIRNATARAFLDNNSPLGGWFRANNGGEGVLEMTLGSMPLFADTIELFGGSDILGNTLSGDEDSPTGGAEARGAASIETLGGNVWLNEVMRDVQESTDGTAIGDVLGDELTDYRGLEWWGEKIAGGLSRMAFNGLDLVDENIRRPGSVGVLEGIADITGFSSESARYADNSNYYEAIQNPVFDRLEELEENYVSTRKLGTDAQAAEINRELMPFLRQMRSLRGAIGQSSGETKQAVREAMRDHRAGDTDAQAKIRDAEFKHRILMRDAAIAAQMLAEAAEERDLYGY